MFHALTGCDTVSFFGGTGKKTAWGGWKVYQARRQGGSVGSDEPPRLPNGPLEVFKNYYTGYF